MIIIHFCGILENRFDKGVCDAHNNYNALLKHHESKVITLVTKISKRFQRNVCVSFSVRCLAVSEQRGTENENVCTFHYTVPYLEILL